MNVKTKSTVDSNGDRNTELIGLMEDYKIEMKQLLDIRTESGNIRKPNKEERKKYKNAWLSYVKMSGFDNDAEKLLWDSFSRFCGAEPFYEYIKSMDDPYKMIRPLCDGKYSKEQGCDKKTQMLYHLFTLSVNEKEMDNKLISKLIEWIPVVMVNKDKKIYGRADETLKKYVLSELSAKKMPNLDEMINKHLISTATVCKFVDIIIPIMKKMADSGNLKKYTGEQKENYKILNDWLLSWHKNNSLSNEKDSKNTSSEDSGTTSVIENDAAEAAVYGEDEKNKDNKLPVIIDKGESIDEKSEQTIRHLAEENKTLSRKADSLRMQIESLKKKNDDLSGELEKNKIKLETLNQDMESLRDTNHHLNAVHRNDQDEISKLVDDLKESEKRAEDLSKMADALSGDDNKKVTVLTNKIKSGLQIEYKDFMDAVQMPMSVDLGENLREQLKNIFRALEKLGIRFE